MTTAARAGLPPMPRGVARLPRDARGYPVPWFVQWFLDGRPTEAGIGTPDFRVADGRKRRNALRYRLCWVCGSPLKRLVAFVVGPMCAVNRVSGDPPEHRDCAEFSVHACPFLTLPGASRREANRPEGVSVPGVGIMRNPGVALLWLTEGYEVVPDEKGSWVLRMGPPRGLLWYCEGRRATRAEVLESFNSGLPILEAVAKAEGPAAWEQLQRQAATAYTMVPA